MFFLVIGFTSPDTTLNFFGVALKNVAGIREVLLALSATVALLIMMLVSSRDTTVYLVQGICRRTVDPKFSDYAKFVLPGIFNFRLYIPRQHDRWVFATFVGKATTIIIALLTIFIALATIVVSFAIHVFIIKEIWQHPTIGSWSYFALLYIGAAYVLNLLILFRRTLPFPYKDMGALKTTPPRQGK
jgi:hypothetical protein